MPEDPSAPIKFDYSASSFFYSIEEWRRVDMSDSSLPLVGLSDSKIIRLGTKNVVEAPEKSFKTTFLQRFMIGLASKYTVYPQMPAAQACRVLYVHGELTASELRERRDSAIDSIPAKILNAQNYIEGRSVKAHFVFAEGQKEIMSFVSAHRPKDGIPYIVVFDPWQAFITGCDENSFKDMSKATSFLDQLLLKTNCTLFIQIHQGKDHSKGARGHSTIQGWKDTTIRLKRKGPVDLVVNVEPRWSNPFEFGLTFRNGTMMPKDIFSPQTDKIRKFVEDKRGWVSREALNSFLGGASELTRKAIQRAINEEAIVKGGKGNYGLLWEDDEDD